MVSEAFPRRLSFGPVGAEPSHGRGPRNRAFFIGFQASFRDQNRNLYRLLNRPTEQPIPARPLREFMDWRFRQ